MGANASNTMVETPLSNWLVTAVNGNCKMLIHQEMFSATLTFCLGSSPGLMKWRNTSTAFRTTILKIKKLAHPKTSMYTVTRKFHAKRSQRILKWTVRKLRLSAWKENPCLNSCILVEIALKVPNVSHSIVVKTLLTKIPTRKFVLEERKNSLASQVLIAMLSTIVTRKKTFLIWHSASCYWRLMRAVLTQSNVVKICIAGMQTKRVPQSTRIPRTESNACLCILRGRITTMVGIPRPQIIRSQSLWLTSKLMASTVSQDLPIITPILKGKDLPVPIQQRLHKLTRVATRLSWALKNSSNVTLLTMRDLATSTTEKRKTKPTSSQYHASALLDQHPQAQNL